MSCWVVPTLAAEFWGVSVDEVTRRINAGEVPTREEAGFQVIDVAPQSPRQEMPRKPVYPPAPVRPLHESQLPRAVDQITEKIEHDTFGDFRLARIQTARLRRPPEARFVN